MSSKFMSHKPTVPNVQIFEKAILEAFQRRAVENNL
jgi:hypothetical protein